MFFNVSNKILIDEYSHLLGDEQGKLQPEGMLGYVSNDYIKEPLNGRSFANITIPSRSTPPHPVPTGNCGLKCRRIWDGHGHWMGDTWRPDIRGL